MTILLAKLTSFMCVPVLADLLLLFSPIRLSVCMCENSGTAERIFMKLGIGKLKKKMIGPFRLWLKSDDSSRHLEWRSQAIFFSILWRLTWGVTCEMFVTAKEFEPGAVEEREVHILCSALFFFLGSVAIFEIIKQGGKKLPEFFFFQRVRYLTSQQVMLARRLSNSVFK